MSRNAFPVDLHVLEGNPNRLTKSEISAREKNKIEVSEKNIKASLMVKNNPVALKEFNRLKKLYKEIKFINSLDEHIINQYCLSVAELTDLLELLETAREALDTDNKTAKLNKAKIYMQIDAEIRQKRLEITRFSDRLYLNPVSRTRNVPAKVKKEDSKNSHMFS